MGRLTILRFIGRSGGGDDDDVVHVARDVETRGRSTFFRVWKTISSEMLQVHGCLLFFVLFDFKVAIALKLN